MRIVKFEEEAERLNVTIEAVQKILEKAVDRGEIQGIIDFRNQEMIYYKLEEIEELIGRLKSGKVSIKVLAEESGLKSDQMRLVIDKLLQEGKIKGSYTYDGAFLSETTMKRLVSNMIEKTGRVNVKELSSRLLVPEEKIEPIVKGLSQHIINVIKPYRRISFTDLSREVNLPENFTIILLKNLISQGKISGSLDKVNRILLVEQIPGIGKIAEKAEIRKEEIIEAEKILPATKEERIEKGFTRNRIIALSIIVFIVFSAIIGGIWWYSLPRTATFTIRIESNTDWQGTIGSIEEGTRSVKGYGSKTFKVTGSVVSAVIQKQTDLGYLRVSIIRDGVVVASQETSAAYGVVSVSAKV